MNTDTHVALDKENRVEKIKIIKKDRKIKFVLLKISSFLIRKKERMVFIKNTL